MHDIVDYAMPCMMAERALKAAHDYVLAKKYDEALDAAMNAMVEAKMTYNAILHMKEQYDALCQQTTPVQERVPTAVGSRRARKANGAAES